MKTFGKHIMIAALAALIPAAAWAQIPVRIVDSLSGGQIAEEVTVTIGGTTRTLNLNAQRRSSYADFILPAPGSYSVQISAKTYYPGGGIAGFGRGTMVVNGGEVMEVVGDYSQNPSVIAIRRAGSLNWRSPQIPQRIPSRGYDTSDDSIAGIASAIFQSRSSQNDSVDQLLEQANQLINSMPRPRPEDMRSYSSSGSSVHKETVCPLCHGSGNFGKSYVTSYGNGPGSYVDKVCSLCGGLGRR